eukprot:TRINITY_DN120754_c0_g1_i1.p1 TRINITY_DN120754_c0_g1~~TRINITY_DN120754_c0_g1_i1.p1  ORF type:complete len:412 (+),score=22.55 TRINITY_DN120754_c0_g1_i1:45-1280(+)
MQKMISTSEPQFTYISKIISIAQKRDKMKNVKTIGKKNSCGLHNLSAKYLCSTCGKFVCQKCLMTQCSTHKADKTISRVTSNKLGITLHTPMQVSYFRKSIEAVDNLYDLSNSPNYLSIYEFAAKKIHLLPFLKKTTAQKKGDWVPLVRTSNTHVYYILRNEKYTINHICLYAVDTVNIPLKPEMKADLTAYECEWLYMLNMAGNYLYLFAKEGAILRYSIKNGKIARISTLPQNAVSNPILVQERYILVLSRNYDILDPISGGEKKLRVYQFDVLDECNGWVQIGQIDADNSQKYVLVKITPCSVYVISKDLTVREFSLPLGEGRIKTFTIKETAISTSTSDTFTCASGREKLWLVDTKPPSHGHQHRRPLGYLRIFAFSHLKKKYIEEMRSDEFISIVIYLGPSMIVYQ